MKTTRTYPIICPSCRGAKIVSNPNFNPYTDDLMIACPACTGMGVVPCTETTEDTTETEKCYTEKEVSEILNDEMRCSEEMNENKTE
jgi:RecJ-like exonuclease